MARPLRIEYPNALYHVISRGNAGGDIYRNNTDRLKHLEWLRKTLILHNVICHAYCLMGNHYHLVIETPDKNLSFFMRDFNGNYSQWFNVRHKRSGHLFQDRFKSYLVEKEFYFLEVLRYVLLNPVRAKLVDHPKKWRWSSYRAIVGEVDGSQWQNTESIYERFGDDVGSAITNFKKFIIGGIKAENPHKSAKNGFILGTDPFVHDVWKKVKGVEMNKEIPRTERIVGRPTLQEIFHDSRNKDDRNDAIKLARYRCGYLCSEIARYLGLDRSTVGKISNTDIS
jgi:putative transposase